MEAFHWAHRIEVGEASLRDELRAGSQQRRRTGGAERLRDDWLSQLDTLVADASTSGRLPPVSTIGHPPFSRWRNSVWQGLTAGQTVAHLPRDKVLTYSTLAAQSDYLADLSDIELDQWNTLGTLAGPGRRFGDSRPRLLRVTLAKAHFSADRRC